jgi:hypothetical protein
MASRNASDDPLLNQWLGVCCLLAVPLVYYFGNDIYAAVGILIAKGTDLFGSTGLGLVKSLWDPSHPTGEFTFKTFLLVLFVGLPVAILSLVVLIVVGLPLAIVGWIMRWLVTGSSGPLHTIVHLACDALLLLLFGSCLYLIVFPVLWVVASPVLAATFGDLTYQRLRARVYGERPRFARPLSLLVGLLSLGFGTARLLLPVVEHGAAAWRAQVKAVYFAPTPPPPAWPKTFVVPAGQIVRTGVVVHEKDEVGMTTTAHLKVGLSGSSHTPILFPKSEPASRTDCFAGVPNMGTCRSKYFVFFELGTLTFYGGDETATVQVGRPGSLQRFWFTHQGETYKLDTEWFDSGDSFSYRCGASLNFRLVSASHATPWRELTVGNNNIGYAYNESGLTEKIPRGASGRLEVRASSTVPTWFHYSGISREAWRYTVHPEALTDTGIRVRPGDRFSVHVLQWDHPFYLMRRSGPYLLHAGNNWIESVDYDGTIRLKGGLTGSEALVHIESRGPGWR